MIQTNHYRHQNDHNCHQHLRRVIRRKAPLSIGYSTFVPIKKSLNGILLTIQTQPSIPRGNFRKSHFVLSVKERGTKGYFQNLTSNRTPSSNFPVNQPHRIDVSSLEGLKDAHIHCVIKHFRSHIPSKMCTLKSGPVNHNFNTS